MSTISSLSSTASQYPIDTQSPQPHHGKGLKAHQSASKLNNLASAPLASSQMTNAASRSSRIATAYQAFQDALNSGKQPDPQNPDVEGLEQHQDHSENNSNTQIDGSTSNRNTAQTVGGLLDALA